MTEKLNEKISCRPFLKRAGTAIESTLAVAKDTDILARVTFHFIYK
ncbi:MAG: hypothetical protein KJ799_08985 [Bacteroidetes bacterium]|nr:hypothetical protein [Bacteroidota bacterium]